ncbi:MAG: hypothetical protein ACLFRV_12890 [Acidimicrobiales bacterium]
MIAVSLLGACTSEAGDGEATREEPAVEAETHRDRQEDDEYAATLADKLAGSALSSFDAEQRVCAGRAIVDAVGGPGNLEELGISVADIENSSTVDELALDPTDETAGTLGAGLVECDISVGELVVARLRPEVGWIGDTPVPADVGAADQQAVETFVDCIDSSLDEQMLGRLFLSDADDHLVESTLRCVAHLEVEEQ